MFNMALLLTAPRTGACEYGDDSDQDGLPDSHDNCPYLANADQDDIDQDGVGDACDDDIDGDQVTNVNDNCPMVSNGDQADDDNDGIGNACLEDCDGDGVKNKDDVCPCVNGISKPDFDKMELVEYQNTWLSHENISEGLKYDRGIITYLEKPVAATPIIWVTDAKFSRVEYEGNMKVSCQFSGFCQDWMGIVFGFQVL